MNYYKVNGQVVRYTVNKLQDIGYKNIESFQRIDNDNMIFKLKDGKTLLLKFEFVDV